MRNIALILFLTCLVFSVQAQNHKLKKTKIAKVVTVKLPKDFKQLNDDEMAQKYTTINRPLAVYADQRAGTDFSVISKPSHFAQDDLPLMKEFYKSSIQSMFSEVRFLKEDIEEINGQNFVWFEFVSSVKDDGKGIRKMAPANFYTNVLYTIRDNKLYIFTFNVPLNYQEKWKETARKVLSSIKFK